MDSIYGQQDVKDKQGWERRRIDKYVVNSLFICSSFWAPIMHTIMYFVLVILMHIFYILGLLHFLGVNKIRFSKGGPHQPMDA